MFQVKIDDKVETVNLRGTRGGWLAYNVIKNGQPVSEISVPYPLDKPFTPFRTSGHRFEYITKGTPECQT